MYKLFNTQIPEEEYFQLKFLVQDNERCNKLVFRSDKHFEVGKKILINWFVALSNIIDKSWLNLSLGSFKVKGKEIFLKFT